MSSDRIAVRADSLCKTYGIYDKPLDRLRQLFASRGKTYGRKFEALADVSFSVPVGKVLGLVGRNGAGKATLLQVLCKTLQPSSGTLEVNGRIAALLELGSGFNPDFTGRENVYLNASVLGLKKAEIDQRFDEIVAFSVHPVPLPPGTQNNVPTDLLPLHEMGLLMLTEAPNQDFTFGDKLRSYALGYRCWEVVNTCVHLLVEHLKPDQQVAWTAQNYSQRSLFSERSVVHPLNLLRQSSPVEAVSIRISCIRTSRYKKRKQKEHADLAWPYMQRA